MPTIDIQFEYTDAEARAVVSDEIQKRIRNRFPNYYGRDLDAMIDEKIRQAMREEVAALDLGPQIRSVIQATLDRVLEDTARRQIKDIVRLAVHRELEAARAESGRES